jgi:signal transduction histidine kinase
MSLINFIRKHHEQISGEFAVFAKSLMPPGAAMNDAELRDHAEEILTAMGRDMGAAQTDEEEARRSRGLGSAKAMAASGKLHADSRIRHGFPRAAVLAEFRALRATVLRLYADSGATDLADVRRFNESVDEALTASMTRFAEQTDLLRDRFIGILSHDLRNPLGAITTGAALLALPEDNPERRARVAATITSSAQRMERLIGDLLDLTQAKLGGAIPLIRRPTDLRQVCNDVITETRARHQDAVLRLETTGSLIGEWDADRLGQVVSNLVGNAIQHGEGTPITLRLREEGDRVTLTVHNGGAPIPPEAMPLIFEPLARGKADRTTGSIGLGLFIARTIVSAHGGHIDVSSSLDAGTTFTVVLPRTGEVLAGASA